MTDYGVDVASFQNYSINWGLAHAPDDQGGSNISFASSKATQGPYYRNPLCANQLAGARGAGVIAGAYHFGDPNYSVEENVDKFVSIASPLGAFSPGAFLPMLDIENSDEAKIFWSPNLINSFVPQFIQLLRQRTGQHKVAIYGSRSWWQTGWFRPDEWADDGVFLWLADYNGDPGNTGGYSHHRLAIHQHTNEGNVRGFAGLVDRNVTLSPFTLQDLTIGGDDDMTEQSVKDAIFATYNQLAGSFTPGEYPGWPSKVDASVNLTLVDYIRYIDQYVNTIAKLLPVMQSQLEAMGSEVAASRATLTELTAKVDRLGGLDTDVEGTLTLRPKSA